MRDAATYAAVLALLLAGAACKSRAPAMSAAGAGGAGGAMPTAGTSAPSPQAGGTGGASGIGGGVGGAGNGGASAGQGGQAGAPLADAGDAGASGATADASVSDASTSPEPVLPPVTDVENDGPFEVTQDLAGGPEGQSGLFHPTDLGRDGLKHPIFVWGCGGGSQPSSYTEVLQRIASHGFVVIAEVSRIGDDGAVLTASLDWIIAENARAESSFAGKLDTTRVAAGGHSIGSVNTFLMATDPRLATTIHVAGGSLDDVNDPFAPTTGMGGMALVHPTALICSASDLFGNVEKTEKDYAAASAPVFFTVMTGTEHIGAATEGLPAIVAWLRWHIGGESERRAMFLEPSGDFQTGKYVSQTKNW